MGYRTATLTHHAPVSAGATNNNINRKGKQRQPVRNPLPLAKPETLNQSWSVDFMHDALNCGHRFRTLNVVDDFNREVLSIE